MMNKLSGIITCLFFLLITHYSFAQNLSQISPDSAYKGQSLAITISGQGTSFGMGTSTATQVWLNQASNTIYPQFIVINSPTQIDAHFTIPASAPGGMYDVNVFDISYGTLTKTNGFKVYTLVGVDEELAKVGASLLISPNPVTTELHLKYELPKPATVSTKLVNMLGQTLYDSGQSREASGDHNIALNVQEMGISGQTCFLVLVVDESVFTTKILVVE